MCCEAVLDEAAIEGSEIEGSDRGTEHSGSRQADWQTKRKKERKKET